VAGAILKQFVYGYDSAGNRLGESVLTDTASSMTSAAHNDLNQLTSRAAGKETESRRSGQSSLLTLAMVSEKARACHGRCRLSAILVGPEEPSERQPVNCILEGQNRSTAHFSGFFSELYLLARLFRVGPWRGPTVKFWRGTSIISRIAAMTGSSCSVSPKTVPNTGAVSGKQSWAWSGDAELMG
jgi:hypothetical protein